MRPSDDRAAAAILALVGAWACRDVDVHRALGAACGTGERSACRAPYVCALDTCRPSCQLDSDCGGGACLWLEETDQWVCTGGLEQDCPAAADDPCPYGTECGIDGVCRNECDAHHACAGDRLCISGTCFSKPPRSVDAAAIAGKSVDASLP